MNQTNPIDLKQRYREGVEFLDNNFAYFLTHVLNIGKPAWTNALPTAAVTVDMDSTNHREDFQFIFSPEFAGRLNVEDFAFVLSHETLHVVLDHLRLCKSFEDKQAFNVAADCVINDYLCSMGFDAPTTVPVLRGEEVVGYDCSNSTVTEVYAAVKKQQQDQPQDGEGDGEGQQGEGSGQGGGQGQGNGDYGEYADGAKALDDHGWLHDSKEKEAQKAQDAAQKAQQQGGDSNPQSIEDKKAQDQGNYKGYSPTGIADGGMFSELGIKLRWVELLRKINPFAFKGNKSRADWSRRPRKLAGFPSTRLPSRDQGIKDGGTLDKPAIVLALDTSGSIGNDTANKFVNLARSIPQNKIKLFPITFTTQTMELDLENPSWNGGGTEFGAIEQYVQNEVRPHIGGKYPKAVVVVTDGYAEFRKATVDEGNKKAWTWLLWEGGQDTYITAEGFDKANIENLSDYIGK